MKTVFKTRYTFGEALAIAGLSVLAALAYMAFVCYVVYPSPV